jgi:hypothetical protein
VCINELIDCHSADYESSYRDDPLSAESEVSILVYDAGALASQFERCRGERLGSGSSDDFGDSRIACTETAAP